MKIFDKKNRTEENEQTFIRYCTKRNTDLVKQYLDNGMDANTPGALAAASKEGNLEIVKLLIASGADIHANNDEALRLAVEHRSWFHRNTATIIFLLQSGADPNVNNGQLLKNICYHKYHYSFPLIPIFIEAGADIHVNKELPLLTVCKYTSLSNPPDVDKKITEWMTKLVEFGADITANDNVALKIVTKKGDLYSAAFLAMNNAQLDSKLKTLDNIFAAQKRYNSSKKAIYELGREYGQDPTRLLDKTTKPMTMAETLILKLALNTINNNPKTEDNIIDYLLNGRADTSLRFQQFEEQHKLNIDSRYKVLDEIVRRSDPEREFKFYYAKNQNILKLYKRNGVDSSMYQDMLNKIKANEPKTVLKLDSPDSPLLKKPQSLESIIQIVSTILDDEKLKSDIQKAIHNALERQPQELEKEINFNM